MCLFTSKCSVLKNLEHFTSDLLDGLGETRERQRRRIKKGRETGWCRRKRKGGDITHVLASILTYENNDSSTAVREEPHIFTEEDRAKFQYGLYAAHLCMETNTQFC